MFGRVLKTPLQIYIHTYDTEAAAKYLFRTKNIDIKKTHSGVFTIDFERVNMFQDIKKN